jgi:nitrile hydratase subunit alpha
MTADHDDAPISASVRRLEALLEERGIVDGATVDAVLDRFVGTASPTNGARLVARAWVDPEFRQRLVGDSNAAVQEMGYSMSFGGEPQRLVVVENTPQTHNVVVCTLCSCYPLALLGPSPSWYRSESYRSRVVREPRVVLAEFGLHLSEDVEVKVWDASSEARYMVVPRRPEGSEGYSTEELSALVTRHGLIGVAEL